MMVLQYITKSSDWMIDALDWQENVWKKAAMIFCCSTRPQQVDQFLHLKKKKLWVQNMYT